MVTAFVLINAEPGAIAELAAQLSEVPGIAEVYSVAGEVDLVAVLRVHDHDDLADVVTKHMVRFEGIRHTQTLLAFRAYSRSDVEASFSIGQ